MEEKDLKKKILEDLDKIIRLLSLSAIIFGGLWLLIYSYLIVKEVPRTIDISLLYYIFATSIFLIISLVFPLVLIFILHFKDNKENISEEKIEKNKNKIMQIIDKILQKIMISISSIIYFITHHGLFLIIFIGLLSIFPISGLPNEYKIFVYPVAILLFLMLQLVIYFYLKDLLRRIMIDKDINALFLSMIFIPTLVILIYPRLFLTVPPKLLKIGYFEANLTLDKEYVIKTEFETCLEKCQPNRLLSQDTQNNNHRTFKFFVFLRTKSEYIVGCSKKSKVRIHIPADKVIAIEY
jgi:hypothetical protein